MIYDAFISYRHSPLDMEIAKKIHSGLENFKIPGAIQTKYGKKSIARVFRDQEELPIGSDLDDNITKALTESEFLIVICSPRTPGSEWVQKEIETFIELHDREHILAVLVEGEPDESFPALLLTDEKGEPVEPLAADVRGADGKERKEKLKTELLRLAAPLIGCSFDDLKQRHRERRLKQIYTTISLASLAIAILGIGFAIYNAYMAAQIDRNYRKAIENQYRYMADKSLELNREGYRKDAALVAVEALYEEGDKLPYVPQAEHALSEALNLYATGNDLVKDGMLEHDSPVVSMEYDTDGCHLITSDKNDKVYVWDVKDNNALVMSVEPGIDEKGRIRNVLAFNHVGDEVIISNEMGVSGYDLTGNELWSVAVEDGQSSVINGSKKIAVTMSNDTLSVIDLENHKITKTFSPVEDSMMFREELRYDETTEVIYATCGKLDSPSKVMIINLKTNQVSSVETKEKYVSAMTYSEDGALYVASHNVDGLIEDITKPYNVYLQKLDEKTGKEIWCYTTEFLDLSIGSNSASVLKCRNYKDENNIAHKEVVFTGNDRIFCIDTDTGEAISSFSMGGSVCNVLLSATGPLGYTVLSSGNIEIINFTEGTRLNDYMISTDLVLTDMRVKDGVLVLSAYSSPDALVMKYHVGQDMNNFFTAAGPIQKIIESSDGKITAIESGYLGEEVLTFLMWTDEKQTEIKNTTEMKEDAVITECCFTADNQFLAHCTDGQTYFIDPVSLEKTVPEGEFAQDDASGSLTLNETNTYAVENKGNRIAAIDLLQKKIIGEWNPDVTFIREARITCEGDRIYFVTDNGAIQFIDVKNNTISNFASEHAAEILPSLTRQSLAISKSGDYLAIPCRDGKMKILRTKDEKICSEVAFLGYNNVYFSFDDAEKCLICQGDDYYIYIYDIVTGEKLYTADRQYSSVKNVSEFMDNKRLAISVEEGLIVLETDSYIPVAEIGRGCMYSASGRVVLKMHRNAYSFPYQTVASLKKSAALQFGEEALTEDKRTKYHMTFLDD